MSPKLDKPPTGLIELKAGIYWRAEHDSKIENEQKQTSLQLYESKLEWKYLVSIQHQFAHKN